MKNLKFFLPFAAVGLLASCSSDNLGEPSNSSSQTTVTEIGDGTYIDLNLALPSVGTRATVYDDGIAEEYAVKDATLYLFDGTGTNAKCVKVIPLDYYFGLANDDLDDITRQKTLTAIDLGESFRPQPNQDFGNYYALVILNKGGLKDQVATALEDNLPSDANGGTTFGDFYNKILDYSGQSSNIFRDDTYFTMMNALGWDKTQEADQTNFSTPTWLVKVDKNNIYYKGSTTTPTPVTIYVQRGLAKVSLAPYAEAGGDGKSKIQIGEWCNVNNDDFENDWIKMTEWTLNVTNQKTYTLQQYESSGQQWYADNITYGFKIENWANLSSPLDRFTKLVDYTPTSNGISPFQRLYWAVDPNYQTQTASDDNDLPFNYISHADDGITYIPNHTTPAYCLENTMRVNAMLRNQTTTAVFHGYYYPNSETKPTSDKGVDFLSLDGKYVVPEFPIPIIDASNFPVTPAANKEPLKGSISSAFLTLDAAITAYDALDGNSTGSALEVFFTKWKDDVATSEDAPGHSEEWQDATTDAENIKAYAQKMLDGVIAKVHEEFDLSMSSNQEVYYHKEGEVYYTVLIRHFNDKELDLDGSTAQSAIENSIMYDPETEEFKLLSENYPSGLDQYLLGRYGVLRNNWYQLELNGVGAIGTPYLPQPEATPDDDEAKKFLDVSIHVLAWAKRYQDVDLQ